MTRYAIRKPEPLLTELSNFAALVRGEPAEVVTLVEGLTTVRVAETLRESAAIGKTIGLRQ
jgi:predicted dehydrogenase